VTSLPTPFGQLERIFKTYPSWLRPAYFLIAIFAFFIPYLVPSNLPSTFSILLVPVILFFVLAWMSFVWLCIAEIVVRVLNRWGKSRLSEARDG
jgi:hypothetical protein